MLQGNSSTTVVDSTAFSFADTTMTTGLDFQATHSITNFVASLLRTNMTAASSLGLLLAPSNTARNISAMLDTCVLRLNSVVDLGYPSAGADGVTVDLRRSDVVASHSLLSAQGRASNLLLSALATTISSPFGIYLSGSGSSSRSNVAVVLTNSTVTLVAAQVLVFSVPHGLAPTNVTELLTGSVVTRPTVPTYENMFAGINWSPRWISLDNNWRSITFGGPNGSKLFVAVADSGNDRIMNSPDGNAWTIRTAPLSGGSAVGWCSVVYGGRTGDQKFVAVAHSSNVNTERAMTSLDGNSWTLRTTPASVAWRSVAVGGVVGSEYFVAVASSSAASSPDGMQWTLRTTAALAWQSVTFGGPVGAKLFVAVASSGSGNRVMTSPDGLTFTTGTSVVDTAWSSVTYGDNVGLFVAVASSGVSNGIMTSTDGLTWTARTNPVNNQWTAVTYGGSPTYKHFVAVAQNGTNNGAMTSVDGITWTPRYVPQNAVWTCVAYGGPSGAEQMVALNRIQGAQQPD
jgi:hypothetical protein